ncbi:unnamed protein product [Calicophoron daubneyi]|uniref:Uncharacterized protein n=1 Tax=Calicophoron daubneyi TaxID=300641 RepID=A0AAV2SZ26_CALDB
MIGLLNISEEWIKERVKVKDENLEDIKTLILQGNYDEKITQLGNSLLHFTRLKILDLSRNLLKTIRGIEHIVTLEVLNLYYNSIDDATELKRLEHNYNLKDLDLRLNPISRTNPDYRIYLIHLLPKLKTLDCRPIRDAERRTAILFFASDQANDYCTEISSPKLPLGSSDTYACAEDLTPARLSTNITADIPQAQRADKIDDLDRLRIFTPSARILGENDSRYESFRPLFAPRSCLDICHLPGSPALGFSSRGLKTAEFYGNKERLQTELDLVGNEHSVCQKHAFQPINRGSKSPDKIINESMLGLNNYDFRSDKDVFRISPRSRSFTCASVYNTGLDDERKPSIVTDPGQEVKKSSLTLQPYFLRPEKYELTPSRVDHTFFLIMKDFIQDAVSESFQRYRMSTEKKAKEDIPRTTVTKRGFNLTDLQSTDKSYDQPRLTKQSSINSNQPVLEKEPGLDEKVMDCRGKKSSLGTPVPVNRKPRKQGELESENLRLTVEVERLRSKLELYEHISDVRSPSCRVRLLPPHSLDDTDIQQRASIVAEPAKPMISASQTLTDITQEMTSAFRLNNDSINNTIRMKANKDCNIPSTSSALEPPHAMYN